MFTIRKVFSSSFTISAAVAELTGTIVSTAFRYSAVATSVHLAVTPPTTFGVLCVCHSRLPGSTRSGENARQISSPTR
jgi:hypothetical protein